MTSFDPFLARVMPSAVACPEPLAIQKIRDAAIEFCERTRVWRSYGAYALTVDADPVLLVAPEGAAIHEIRSAKVDEQPPLEPISSLELDRRYPNWRTETPQAGTPRYIAQIEIDSVTVYPRADATLTLEAVLKPSITATELPAVLASHFIETIAQGALGRILLLPARDFSNPQLGATQFQLFQAAIDRRATASAKGQQKAPLRTRARFL